MAGRRRKSGCRITSTNHHIVEVSSFEGEVQEKKDEDFDLSNIQLRSDGGGVP